MKESAIRHFPAAGEMAFQKIKAQFEVEKEQREQFETTVLERAYIYGYCHIPCCLRGKSAIDVFNELPDYIMIKDREFKKDLNNAWIKDFDGRKIPFARYTATDGCVMEAPTFIWVKRSQVRPTRVLTIKY